MEFLPKKIIIQINKEIIKEWNQANPGIKEDFCADEHRLNEAYDFAKKQEDFMPQSAYIMAQSAYIMAGIAWAQPFCGGNKRTAVISADTWLRINGYTLTIEDDMDREYIRSLLFEIQESRSEMDGFTLSKIILYVSKRLVKHG